MEEIRHETTDDYVVTLRTGNGPEFAMFVGESREDALKLFSEIFTRAAKSPNPYYEISIKKE